MHDVATHDEANVRRCRCGTRLARDNGGLLCGPCRTSSRDLLAGPPSVPESFWRERNIQDALQAWHIGKVIAAYRLHPWHGEPIPQQTVAAWLGISQARLSRIENGEPIQDLGRLTELARILAVPAALLWFRLPGATTSAMSQHQPTHDLDALASDAAQKSLAFAAQASHLVCDQDALDHLRWELGRIAVSYVHAPIETLFGDLLHARDTSFELLAQQRRPREARELYFLSGTACLLLAHASQNIGSRRSAMAQLRTAWTCATAADHDGLRAWSRGSAALFNEWTSQPATATALAAQGMQYEPSRDSRIRLTAIEARAAARIGDRRRALDAIGRLQTAQSAAAYPDDVTEFGGVLSFPEAKQSYYLGGTYGLLGDHHAAETHALAAIRAYETGSFDERSYGDEALARMDVVNARIACGEVDGAEEALAPVLQLPPDRRIDQLKIASGRTARALREHPVGRTGKGRELATRIEEFGRGQPPAITSA